MTSTEDKIVRRFLAWLMVCSVFAGTIVLSGGAAAAVGNQSDVSFDDKLDSQQVFWQGQGLLVDADESVFADAIWQVWTVTSDDQLDSLVQEFNLDENGMAVIDTSNLDGQYVVTTSDRDLVTVEEGDAAPSGDSTPDSETWRITLQTMDAAFSADQVGNAGDSAKVGLGITSNRADYDVSVTATRDGSAVSETTLLSVFPSAERGTPDDGAILVPAQADTTETLDFSGATSGSYAFSLVVTDTTASSTASVEVEEPTRTPTETSTAETAVETSPTPTVVTEFVTKQGPSPTPRVVTVTETTGQPGFGIAVALVALLAAVMLAVRSD